MMTVNRTGLGALVALVVALAGCGAGAGGPSPTGAAGPGAIRVVTTTTVFADIVKSVGGARADVKSIIPPGVGPEDYEPKPDDARSLADAQLIVSNGVGLDDFLNRLLESGSGGKTPRLVLGEGIEPILVDGEPNPHFWLDPSLVKSGYLPKIVTALSALAPGDAATFQANAAAYASQLDALDAELKTKVDTIPQANRKLVTFHDAFPYFARHYGFELVGVVLANVGQEPNAAELAALVEKVKAAGVKAVFSEAQFNAKLAQTLADEAGIKQVVTTLYNDALGPAPADSYPGMMRWNVDEIVEALR
jgi:zinc/manganese transport system substrate-binding protein/manganese/iron transport system substrate-binding protein